MEVIKQLLDAKTDINGRGSDGWIGQCVAGYNGGGEVAAGRKDGRLRVRVGRMDWGDVLSCRTEVMKQLMDAKTDVKARDKDEWIGVWVAV
jgi:hypothetical protein